MTLPREQYLDTWHKLNKATEELETILRRDRKASLAAVDSIARRHDVETAQLISNTSMTADCEVDYTAGEIRCR